jgi:spore maturation protein CgeB
MKKSLFILAFLILLTAIGFTTSALLPTKPFTLIYAEDGEINALAQSLTQELNRQAPKTNKKYHLYVANFENNYIPDIKDNTAVNILYLGSQGGLAVNTTDHFDYIFTAHPLLQNFLQNKHQTATLLPLFTAPHTYPKKERSFFAVIGNPRWATEILDDMHQPYRRYTTTDTAAIRRDLPYFKAVFAENTGLFPNSLDLHPLYPEIALNKIPLLAYWAWPDVEEPLNLFNHRINFYVDKAEGKHIISQILQNDSEINLLTDEAQAFVQEHFLPNIAAQTILRTLNHTPEPPAPANSVNLNLPTAVGHTNSGDYSLMKDLALSLKELNYHPGLDFFNSPFHFKTAYNIILRGYMVLDDTSLSGEKNIFYLAYPHFKDDVQAFSTDPDAYFNAVMPELSKTDLVVSASKKFCTELQNRRMDCRYIPQFTNPHRLYPDFQPSLQSEILFVGSYTAYRSAAPIALKHGFPVTIYGPNWPNGQAKEPSADNKILRQYYSSAKIVLNDTREDMTAFDIISNRIFDATACGTLVISDYIPAIEEAYGDTVPMYKTEEELVNLLTYYLDPAHEEERLDKARRAREITLQNFTSDIVARQFDTIIKDLKAAK